MLYVPGDTIEQSPFQEQRELELELEAMEELMRKEMDLKLGPGSALGSGRLQVYGKCQVGFSPLRAFVLPVSSRSIDWGI